MIIDLYHWLIWVGGEERAPPRSKFFQFRANLAKSYVDAPRTGNPGSATVYLIFDIYFPLTNPKNSYTERGLTFDNL